MTILDLSPFYARENWARGLIAAAHSALVDKPEHATLLTELEFYLNNEQED